MQTKFLYLCVCVVCTSREIAHIAVIIYAKAGVQDINNGKFAAREPTRQRGRDEGATCLYVDKMGRVLGLNTIL